jgi:hypothetical protein
LVLRKPGRTRPLHTLLQSAAVGRNQNGKNIRADVAIVAE